MTFQSILFEKTDNIEKEALKAPVFLVDLNLDQIVDAMTAGKQEYNSKPFFYTRVDDIDAIKYRQEIFRDLETNKLFGGIKSFSQKTWPMREHLAQANKLYYKYQRGRGFLETIEIYCNAVNPLVHGPSLADLKSHAFLAFRKYRTDYANGERFRFLLAETRKLFEDLSCVKYCMLIKDAGVKVRNDLFQHLWRPFHPLQTGRRHGHEKREIDEELSRMSDIVDKITANTMILFNESFAVTNGREGSEIARKIVSALFRKDLKVFFVMHLYEFAHAFVEKKTERPIFLRAERQADGEGTFKLLGGEPLETSYGEDLYNMIFNDKGTGGYSQRKEVEGVEITRE